MQNRCANDGPCLFWGISKTLDVYGPDDGPGPFLPGDVEVASVEGIQGDDAEVEVISASDLAEFPVGQCLGSQPISL